MRPLLIWLSALSLAMAAVLAGPAGGAGINSAAAQGMSNTSTAFQRFQFSFFEDKYSERDGLDVAALAELQGDERKRAEDMLLAYLPDTRGVIGLGVLRSSRAEPRLIKLLDFQREKERAAKLHLKKAWWSFELIEIAKALWLIRPDPRWLDEITRLFSPASDVQERHNAAQALAAFDDPAAAPVLVAALDDADHLVRHHAGRSLLVLHGLPVDVLDPEHMLYRVMAEEARRREGGKRDILAAIAGRSVRRAAR